MGSIGVFETNTLKKLKKEGFKLGFKLVRGAYMEKERERAQRHNYVSPICVSKSATDLQFNDCLKYVLGNIETISIFFGTHNEQSTQLALDHMSDYKIKVNDNRIWFGQLLWHE